MLEPVALPTLEKNSSRIYTAVEQPASPRRPAPMLGGPSLKSQTFEMLATAFVQGHCVSLRFLFFHYWLHPQC